MAEKKLVDFLIGLSEDDSKLKAYLDDPEGYITTHGKGLSPDAKFALRRGDAKALKDLVDGYPYEGVVLVLPAVRK